MFYTEDNLNYFFRFTTVKPHQRKGEKVTSLFQKLVNTVSPTLRLDFLRYIG